MFDWEQSAFLGYMVEQYNESQNQEEDENEDENSNDSDNTDTWFLW